MFVRICAGNRSKRPLFLTSNCWEPYTICSLIFKKWHRFCCARICRFICFPVRNPPPPPVVGNNEMKYCSRKEILIWYTNFGLLRSRNPPPPVKEILPAPNRPQPAGQLRSPVSRMNNACNGRNCARGPALAPDPTLCRHDGVQGNAMHAVRMQCEVLDDDKYSNPSFGPFSQVLVPYQGFFTFLSI